MKKEGVQKFGLYFLVFLLSIACVFGQDGYKIIARAYYDYSHLLDTTRPGKQHKEEMLLAIGQSATVFTSIAKLNQVMDFKQQKQKQDQAFSGQGINITTYTASRYTISEEIYVFQDQQKVFVKEYVYRNYLYEDDYPNINWHIKSDTLTIGNFKCQMATANFRGRLWNAWFCPDLPINAGPWKLFGLPGLIVKADDSSGQVSFTLTSFNLAENDIERASLDEYDYIDYTKIDRIALPPEKASAGKVVRVVRASKKDVERLWRGFEKNRQAFYYAQLEASNWIIQDTEGSHSLAMRPKINNPIELIDQ